MLTYIFENYVQKFVLTGNIYYTLCVCVCGMCVLVRVGVHVCVRACMHSSVCVYSGIHTHVQFNVKYENL